MTSGWATARLLTFYGTPSRRFGSGKAIVLAWLNRRPASVWLCFTDPDMAMNIGSSKDLFDLRAVIGAALIGRAARLGMYAGRLSSKDNVVVIDCESGIRISIHSTEAGVLRELLRGTLRDGRIRSAIPPVNRGPRLASLEGAPSKAWVVQNEKQLKAYGFDPGRQPPR
jgi:hypothetical protein